MKLYQLFFIKALFLLSLTSFSTNANALAPYKHNWTKIKSEHFTVVVDENFLPYGRIVANKAEQAFQALQRFSKKHPKNTFILVDHTKGFSNGSATFFPYPIITLQPVTPTPSTSVGQYDDWLYELLVHEYTHILSFHNTKGLFTPLRRILGSTIAPGYFMPPWYQEGIAVFTETYLSNGGRLRSANYQALKKELSSSISIASNNAANKFPFGSSSYIYGGWLNQNAFSETGVDGAAKVHKTFSGRIPYFINGGYKKNKNKSLYRSWGELFGKHKAITPVTNAFAGRLPKLVAEKTYFIAKDLYNSDEFRVRNIDGQINTLFKSQNILNYQVHKNKIYYLKSVLKDYNEQTYSLFTYNLENKKNKVFSTKELKDFNIKNFDISGDNRIIFIDAQINKNSLYIGELVFNKSSDHIKGVEKLFSTDLTSRISFSKFKNKKQVLFSLKRPNEPESLKLIDLETLTVKNIISTDHITGLEKDNRGFFHMISESNGQKFLHDLTNKSKIQIHSGILSLDFQKNDTVLATRTSSKGPYIFNYSKKQLLSDSKPINIVNQALLPSSSDNTPLKETKYSSFSKLQPHYIIPNASSSPYGFSGEFLYGIGIGGQDPLGLNSYALNISTDSITDKVSTNLNYTSRHFKLPISISGGVINTPLSLNFFRESTFASIGTGYALKNDFSKNFDLSLHAFWNSTDGGFNNNGDKNPDLTRAGGALSLLYNDSQLRSRELAPSKGFRIQTNFHHYLDGHEFTDYTRVNGGLRLYFTSPIAKSHRLILGFDGEVNNKGILPIFSSNSLNQPYRTVPIGSFALRGLGTGTFFATDSFVVAHLEYRFPLLNINWGPGLLPGFFNRITGALTADYGSLKGLSLLDGITNIDHSTPLYSAGGEIIIEGTAFYHLPSSLQIGYYKFLNSDVSSASPEVFIGFGITGLP